MKLRNKKTGEVITSKELLTDEFIIDIFSRNFDYFNSKLRKLQDEWEEYEEPKDYWFITWCGDVDKETDDGLDVDNKCREIGNYFESREEAEKAVKKLKAWKFLKDECDIKFDGIIRDDKAMLKGVKLTYDKHEVTFERMRECMECLHFLFGGER